MKLSILIATRNRASAIGRCLDAIAIALARAPDVAAEIVVVDNGSTDDTSARVKAWAEPQTFPLRVIYEPRAGLSVARNTAVRAARGDLLVFTDDDCRMTPDYVVELLRYDAQDTELVMRSGWVILGDPTDLPLTIKSVDQVKRWKRPMPVTEEGRLLGGSLIGCNMAMRRDVLDLLGPFDERLGAGTACPAGEDTHYFYRGYLAGNPLEIVPDMVVAHDHGRKTIEQRTKLMRNYALGNGALATKYLLRHPTFARHLIWEFKACAPLLFHRLKEGENWPWLSPRDRLFFMICGVFGFAALRLGARPKAL